MYLIDTDTLSNLTKSVQSRPLLARLARVPADEQATSSITVGELLYGALRSAGDRPRLLGQIERVILAGLTVLPFDAARQYASLRADLERQGMPFAEADLRIASIALVHGLILVTGNVRHFARVPGLTVENWLAWDTSAWSAPGLRRSA